MSSIAIFPCFFTPDEVVAKDISQELGLKFYTDENLIYDTSSKFGIHSSNLRLLMFGKTSVFNQFTLERETGVNMFRSVLVDKLSSPQKYIFYGYHSSLFSLKVNHILKVFITDTRENRLKVAIRKGYPKSEAKRELNKNDTNAYAWANFLYNKGPEHRSLHDIIILASGKEKSEISSQIRKFYYTTSVLRTIESQRAIGDMSLEVQVEALLLQKGHKILVNAEGGTVTLVVEKNVLSMKRLSKELSKIAKKIEGVREVLVKKGSKSSESFYRKIKFELPSKVLFVDDEKEFVQTVSRRLIKRDVGTYGVYNGAEALELIVADRPDVMVLDLKMPGLSGVEVLRRTKKLDPEVEVIILTGQGTKEDEEHCLQLGASVYLNKPVDIDKLSECIKLRMKI